MQEIATMKRIVFNIRTALKAYIIMEGIQSLTLGISGGIDSAVCAVLARSVCDELGIPLIGRSITIESNKKDEIERAKEVGIFCTEFKEVDLTELYKIKLSTYEAIEGILDKIARGNLKARTRMEYLFGIAGKNKGLVLSTDNLTEFYLGFWTLHGDVGNYGMIQNLWKTEVYLLAQWLNDNEVKDNDILIKCIEAIPTDGLGISNSDLDQLFPNWQKQFKNCREGYEGVDKILKTWFVEDSDSFCYDDWLEYENRISEYGKFEKYRISLKEHPVIERHKASHYKRRDPFNIERNTLMKIS